MVWLQAETNDGEGAVQKRNLNSQIDANQEWQHLATTLTEMSEWLKRGPNHG